MSADSPSPSEPLPGTVFNARQARLLKLAVIVMGLMLVVGFVLLLSAIVYQASRLGESAPAASTASSAPGGSSAAIGLDLPAGSSVSHMALDGDRLAVHVIGDQGAQILVLDLASGDIVTRIRLPAQ